MHQVTQLGPAEPELVSGVVPVFSVGQDKDTLLTQLPLLGKHMLSKGEAAGGSMWGAGRGDSTALLIGEAFL